MGLAARSNQCSQVPVIIGADFGVGSRRPEDTVAFKYELPELAHQRAKSETGKKKQRISIDFINFSPVSCANVLDLLDKQTSRIAPSVFHDVQCRDCRGRTLKDARCQPQ